MSDTTGMNIRPGMVVKDYELPNITGQQAVPDAERYEFAQFTYDEVVEGMREYVFTPFSAEDDTEKAALTLAEAKEEALKIIAQARTEAEGIKAEAQAMLAEAESIKAGAKAEGKEQGRQEGLAQGSEQGLREFEANSAPALSVFERVDVLYQDLWKANEAALVKLAVQIAEKVLYHEIETSPELINNAFKAALDQLQDQHKALFRVNPEDLDYLESLKSEVKDRVKGLLHISFEPDSSLERGDLVMETESGRLDVTLKRRLEAVSQSIEKALGIQFDLDW